MAVTVGQLAAAIRLTDGAEIIITEDVDGNPVEGEPGAPPEPQLSIITRLAGVADAFLELLIPNAPEAIQDECKVRFVAYLYDAPTAGRGDFFSNSWRNSGAGSLAARWVVRRAGIETEVTP